MGLLAWCPLTQKIFKNSPLISLPWRVLPGIASQLPPFSCLPTSGDSAKKSKGTNRTETQSLDWGSTPFRRQGVRLAQGSPERGTDTPRWAEVCSGSLPVNRGLVGRVWVRDESPWEERTIKREADGRTPHLEAQKPGEAKVWVMGVVGGDASKLTQDKWHRLQRPARALGCDPWEVAGYRTIWNKGITLCNYQRQDQINGHKRISWLS